MSTPKKPNDTHNGHRDRMRKEIKHAGFRALADHRLLEYYLFPFIPRKDTNGIAHALITTFGSLSNVLYADYAELMQVKGMTENAALGITALPEFLRRVNHSMTVVPGKISSFKDAAAFCRTEFFRKKHEQVLMVCLDSVNRILNSRIITEGGLITAALPVRTVCEEAYRFKAHKVLLSHNHPSGLAIPSQEDMDFTTDLTIGLSYLGIVLLDHLIVTENDFYSFRQEGAIQTIIDNNSDKIAASVADAVKETSW